MRQQLLLNGKTPCANWLPAPIIFHQPEVTFIKEYVKLNIKDKRKRGEMAKQNALNKAKSSSELKEQIELDSLAFFLALNPKKQKFFPKVQENYSENFPQSCTSCSQDIYYWILGFSIVLLLLFFLFVYYFEFKKS